MGRAWICACVCVALACDSTGAAPAAGDPKPVPASATAAPTVTAMPASTSPPASVGYLEIVTPEVNATCALYEGMYGLKFGDADEALGFARAATRPDGSLVGVRRPLAAHEGPIVRAYLAVDDIHAAVKAAEQAGATLAYPPTSQGGHGSFAIVIQDEVEHGLWQSAEP